MRSRRKAVLSLQAMAALLASGFGASALAQQWNVGASISSQLTWTSNSNLGSSDEQGDTIVNVRPRFDMRREGARLRVAGFVELNAFSYANGTQPSRLLPQADLNARLEAIERLFYVEGEVRALQTSQNPFGANPDTAAANSNTVTTTVVRLSPYIERSIGSDFRYRLRSDNIHTSANGSTFSLAPSSAGGRFGRHSALIEQDPRPFGWRLEAERSDTHYDDSAQPSLVLDLARASVNYAIGQEFDIGARGGYERDSLVTGPRHSRIYGVQFRWRPSERTQLTGFREQRFFGTSWRVAFEHRMPWLAWNFVFSRGVESAPQLLFELPVTGNVAALLDAMFTTRYPDATERARVVQDFMSSRGLPDGTYRPTNIYSQRLSLVTLRSGSIGYVGPRSSITLSGFHWRTQDALANTPLTVDAAFNNNVQYGAAVVVNHRLTRLTSLNLEMDYSRIRALQAIAQDNTKQAEARLRVNFQTSPHTNAFLGGRYRKLASNVVRSGDETSLFAGLTHSF